MWPDLCSQIINLDKSANKVTVNFEIRRPTYEYRVKSLFTHFLRCHLVSCHSGSFVYWPGFWDFCFAAITITITYYGCKLNLVCVAALKVAFKKFNSKMSSLVWRLEIHCQQSELLYHKEIVPMKTVNSVFCGWSRVTKTVSEKTLCCWICKNVNVQCSEHHKWNPPQLWCQKGRNLRDDFFLANKTKQSEWLETTRGKWKNIFCVLWMDQTNPLKE